MGPTCFLASLAWVGQTYYVQLSDLGLPPFLLVFSGPLRKGASFCEWIGVQVEQAFLIPFLLLVGFYFLLQGQEWLHLSTPGAASCCFDSTVFSKCVNPLDGPHSKLNIYNVSVKGAPKVTEEVTCRFQFASHSL